MSNTSNPVAWESSGGRAPNIIRDLESFIAQYVTVEDESYYFAAALWTMGTFLWPHFDAYPYLVITSATKRSGKTRLAEVISFACSNPRFFAAMTPATLFYSIRNDKPTLFVDEAEVLSKETANDMRAILNAGYRRGQSIPRMGRRGQVVEWPAYCPKAFILIGDVFDTLRDRSIVIRMQRGEPRRRFLWDEAKGEGEGLRERASLIAEDAMPAIMEQFTRHAGLGFLMDRDEEIWIPLFAIANVLCPDRIEELQRAAVDMATMKTEEAARYVNLIGAEREVEDDEYARRLLRDLWTVMDGKASIYTAEAIEALHAIPTAPWRKFRGAGLSAIDLANMLARFNGTKGSLRPKLIKTGSKKKGARKPVSVKRGYRREDVRAALKEITSA